MSGNTMDGPTLLHSRLDEAEQRAIRAEKFAMAMAMKVHALSDKWEPVVHCRECKRCIDGACSMLYVAWGDERLHVSPNDYCSHARRKETE